MTYATAFTLLGEHLWGAVGMALLFGAGMLAAIPVMRHRIRALLLLPEFLARLLTGMLQRDAGTLRMAAFIFLFNANAIFLYMLTGLLAMPLPGVTAFFAGLNVALASLLAQERLPRVNVQTLPLRMTARLGAVMTFALELPSLWFALALGMTMHPRAGALLQGADAGPVRARILAYLWVIVPVLAVSALAEAHAVVSAVRAAKAQSSGTPPPHENDRADDDGMR